MGLVRNLVFVSLRGWFWRFTVPPLNIASLSWCVRFVSLFLLVTKIRVWLKHRLRMLSNDRFWACFRWHVFSQPWRRCDFFSHGTLVGWGGLITFIFLCTQTSCYATVHSLARAHIRHETLLYVLLHVHTYIMLCYCTVLYVFLRVHTYVMLCMFSCTCTHTSCYVMITLLLHLHTHTHTHLMLRCDLFSCTLMPSCNILSCTRTDTGRYVASFFLALSNISHFLCRHLFYIVLLFYCCIFMSVVNSRSEWARKVVQGKTANRSLLERHIYILKGLRPLPPTPRPLEAGKCLTLLSEATRKALGKRPECCKSLRRRRRGAFEARLLPPECSKSLWQGRREAFGGRQVPNVAFWSH